MGGPVGSARVTSDRATPGRCQARPVVPDPSMAAALAIGGAHTLVVVLLPGLRLAYENPALHLTLETAEGLIAALLAYLGVGRFRSTGRLEQLAVAWAFAVMAVVNLFLSAGPITVLGTRPVGAVEERRRVARDLHDGLTQELAFIRSQTAAMAGGTVIPDMAGHVAAAAERASTSPVTPSTLCPTTSRCRWETSCGRRRTSRLQVAEHAPTGGGAGRELARQLCSRKWHEHRSGAAAAERLSRPSRAVDQPSARSGRSTPAS